MSDDRRPDERWYRGDTGEPYWRESTAGEDRWIIVLGEPERPVQDAPQPAPDAPGRPSTAPVAIAPTPEPTPVPVTRAQRIRNLVAAVRSGDRSAVDALREALMQHD